MKLIEDITKEIERLNLQENQMSPEQIRAAKNELVKRRDTIQALFTNVPVL